MSGSTIFFLILGLMLLVAGLSFYYGIKIGVRAERTNWDLRRMMRPTEPADREDSISELELAINEQLGFWQGEPDDVDSSFCDNYKAMLTILQPRIEALRKKSSSRWKKIQPVWERIEFKKVTMATCIQYELTRTKVMDNLKELLAAFGRKPSRKYAA